MYVYVNIRVFTFILYTHVYQRLISKQPQLPVASRLARFGPGLRIVREGVGFGTEGARPAHQSGVDTMVMMIMDGDDGDVDDDDDDGW